MSKLFLAIALVFTSFLGASDKAKDACVGDVTLVDHHRALAAAMGVPVGRVAPSGSPAARKAAVMNRLRRELPSVIRAREEAKKAKETI